MADTTQTRTSNSERPLVAFDERTRRVMELRRQVREGTYHPDPAAVATALMREWGFMDDLLEEVAEPMPAIETADERRAAAIDRFVIGKTATGPEATSAKAG